MTTESTGVRPSSFPCPQCQASPDDQQLVRAPTGWVWRCRRCHGETSRALPFDPRLAPDGRESAWAAIDTLAVYVPIIAPIDNELLYEILRPYFKAGWCVRDVLHALNYLPDGDTHPGQGAAWIRGEDRDRTLWRIRQRLRRWRFSDREEGEDVMNGPYSTTARAMADHGAGQRERAVARDQEWRERAAAARSAAHSGAREVARRQAKIAASLAREAASRADAAERERLVADIARGREAADVWRTAIAIAADSLDSPVTAGPVGPPVTPASVGSPASVAPDAFGPPVDPASLGSPVAAGREAVASRPTVGQDPDRRDEPDRGPAS